MNSTNCVILPPNLLLHSLHKICNIKESLKHACYPKQIQIHVKKKRKV